MGLMKKLFGTGRKDKPPTAEEGIQRLREVENMLKKKSDYIEKQIELQINTAKKNGSKNQRAAIRALKTKKQLERRLQQMDKTLTTIEYQREALETSGIHAEVINVMKVASKALEGVHKELDVEEAHQIMDEATEQMTIADELAGAISNPENIGGPVIDEGELLAELVELEQDELEEKQPLDVGEAVKHLPSVPSAKLPGSSPSTSGTARGRQKECEELKDEENEGTRTLIYAL